jgi:hypothetical protein
MIELYFILYRLPRMMTRLVRERNRSALAWSLAAISAWIGTELFVAMALNTLYYTGVLLLDLPLQRSPLFSIAVYGVSLVSAIVAVSLVRRALYQRTETRYIPLPPPPPRFEGDAH